MKEQLKVTLKLHVEVSTKKIVKIKAHKRIINGKTVKVRSHYRVIEGLTGSGIGLTASWRCLLPLGVYSRDNASWCYLCLYLGTILSDCFHYRPRNGVFLWPDNQIWRGRPQNWLQMWPTVPLKLFRVTKQAKCVTKVMKFG